jgi:hypothetical protein
MALVLSSLDDGLSPRKSLNIDPPLIYKDLGREDNNRVTPRTSETSHAAPRGNTTLRANPAAVPLASGSRYYSFRPKSSR